jgi:alpha-tubulin suppressor-like RCC1 family protein
MISFNAISALLLDGRLWNERTEFSGFNGIIPRLNTQHFVDGSNWTDIASDNFRVVAIQANGSLWSFQTYDGWRGMPPYPLTQIGSDRDWLRVAGDGNCFLLLKNDGTLWTWGANGWEVDSSRLKKYLAIPPRRLDEGTNWTDVFSYNQNFGPFARKSDGSIWAVSDDSSKTNFSSRLWRLPSSELASQGFTSLGWMIGWIGGVKTNGELWLILDQANQKPREIQLGKNEKWKEIMGAGENSLIALRSDGTLWKFSILIGANRSQMGNHSDWIAFSTSRWHFITLAADGSIWAWDEPSGHRWLAPSRKPVFIGNIFQGANSKTE